MTSRSAPGLRFVAAPFENGAAVRIGVPEANLDFDAADVLKAPLREAIEQYLADGHRAFVLDLIAVETIDSGGVGLLIALHHQVVGAGGSLVLAIGTPFVRKMLRMMRLDRFLEVESTVARALRALVDVD